MTFYFWRTLFSLLAPGLAMALVMPGCAQPEAPQSTITVNEDHLRGHVEFLAADSLQGRDTGSAGYQVAADYVAAEFRKLGLAPAGNDGSYFQAVPLVRAVRVENSVSVRLHATRGDVDLDYPQQFIMGPDLVESSQSITAELVFVGYGIVAEEYNHDDYENIDVEGKIVVMLNGRPPSWPSEEGAHLGSGTQKARHAAERGAVGLLRLHTPRREKVRPYEENYPYLDIPRMNWIGPDGRPDEYHPELQGGAYLNMDAAAVLFDSAPVALETLYQADSDGDPITGFELPISATLTRQSSQQPMASPNVVAILEGSDPVLKQEYLVYSAHLDHLGVIPGEDGEDEIYNGAMDNAAGIAVMLETARILAAQKSRLKRSVLFIAVTGEEKGLLGAGFFARNPTVPIDSLVANINLDMPVLVFPFADVVAFGADHSDLKATVEKAANDAGITLSPDPIPEQTIFVRSDHYRFVQQGIPAVYLATGFTSRDPNQNGEELWYKFNKAHYHQPSDQADLPIDYASAAIFAEININIGREICNAPARPSWNKGDFFGRTFSRDNQEPEANRSQR